MIKYLAEHDGADVDVAGDIALQTDRHNSPSITYEQAAVHAEFMQVVALMEHYEEPDTPNTAL